MDFKPLYDAQICPVCGFFLDFKPWVGERDQPCPCCGIHFGEHDVLEAQRWQAYAIWRRRWVEDGMRWWSSRPAPSDYNPTEQLTRLKQLLNE